jgi:glycosyltransferase involved in cell wall biosynthesis
MTEFKRVPTRFSVLFLAKWYPNYADEQLGVFVQKHAAAVAKNCDVAVVYTSSAKQKEKYNSTYAYANNVHEILVHYRKSNFAVVNFWRYLVATRKAIKTAAAYIGKPDIVHTHVLTRTYFIAQLLCAFKGIPFIITEHWTGYISGKFEKLSLLKKLIVKRAAKKAKYVTAVSQSLKSAMENCGIDGNYVIVPNIIESKNLALVSKKDVAVKFLTVADLVDSQKNISATIAACEKLKKQNLDFEFHVIGGGADEKMLQSLADEKKLNDKVFFHGRQPNNYVLEKLNEFDFVVVNSRVESFCVVAAEALAAGKPVVATICGGPEFFIDETNGILIPVNDDAALQNAIKKMMANYSSYNTEKLKQTVAEKFSAEVVSMLFQQLYDNMCAEFVVGLSGKKQFIHPDWLVLDVGSGHRPNKRADVLIDSEMGETIHRSGKTAISPKGKQMMVADALLMPFADKQFDYVIASHIAEHVDDPLQLCKEISRVGKRGYIECPGPLDEFFLNEPFHKWIVKKNGNTLFFKEKKNFKPFSPLIYGLYYLNINRFGHKTLKSNSLILKMFSKLLIRIWKIMPNTYSKLAWSDSIQSQKM